MYSFLDKLTLVDTGRQRTPKEKNPTGLTLRILSNGEVYPSSQLVDHFKLEYEGKGNDLHFGFDIVDSKEWNPTESLPRMIMLGVTKKSEAKVDLFASCRYNDSGMPRSSVMTQGTTSETLLNLVKSMGYLTEDQKYCDLEVVIEHPITTQDGIYNLPKTIERGGKKGEKTYARRDNITLYPINTVENLKTIREQTTNQQLADVAASN